MSTGAVIALTILGVATAAVICSMALLVAVRWTRRHPDHHGRKAHRGGRI
ncbi:hypothetical protein [Nocardia sp. NPDC052112]